MTLARCRGTECIHLQDNEILFKGDGEQARLNPKCRQADVRFLLLFFCQRF